MFQTAVFVDAGYLFAAGSSLIAGANQPREQLTLDIDKVIKELVKSSDFAAPTVRLLRIYWYDGIKPSYGPSPEQIALGQKANIKLRLGMINSRGQQKGVDSLIVTDLIDLARNNAISDALILAGDEDLRVGVQVAQTYGVRTHLLGIEPSRGNQSPHLLQEVDGHSEWNKSTVSTFMKLNASSTVSKGKPPLVQPSTPAARELNFEQVVNQILERFDALKKGQIKVELETTRSLPREVDAPILAQARHLLGRDLNIDEKRQLRNTARQIVEKF